MIIIKKLEQTCGGCPSQWEGEDIDGNYVYIRYRWGILRMDHKEHFNTIFSQQLDPEGWGGIIEEEEMLSILKKNSIAEIIK